MSLLSVQGLCKSFGGVVAARDVGFDLGAGELLALIGPNGAGKTTTFNMVGGQLRPDAGAVVLDGADVDAPDAARKIPARGRAHLPGRPDLPVDDRRRERPDGADQPCRRDPRRPRRTRAAATATRR